MPGRISSIAMAIALCLGVGCAAAAEQSQYPQMTGQWTRLGSAQFDPTKPAGFAQQAPLTQEYHDIFAATIKDRNAGGLAANATASCTKGGMPRTMIGYEPIEFIVTPETTYVMGSYMNELRRIFTDGRDWPARITPAFVGYSIGKWEDTDGDGRFDTLIVETRGFRGPRTYDGAGMPLHKDNQTILKERIYLDKSDPDVLHDELTTIDHALTRPWTVHRKYHREREPIFNEYVCAENNQTIMIGKENYYVSADGYLMPTKKDQPPPDLRFFTRKE